MRSISFSWRSPARSWRSSTHTSRDMSCQQTLPVTPRTWPWRRFTGAISSSRGTAGILRMQTSLVTFGAWLYVPTLVTPLELLEENGDED